MSRLLFIIFVSQNFIASESARILAMFPTPSISHQVVFRPLMAELAKRGHEVVVITTDPAHPTAKAPQNYTEIDVHEISYRIWNEFMELSKGSETDVMIHLKVAFELFIKIFEAQIQTEEVQKLINDPKGFDLLFIESCVRSSLSLSYVYKVPVIQFSSLGGLYEELEYFGTPVNPLLYPIAAQRRVFNQSFWEKISEVHCYLSYRRLVRYMETLESQSIKNLFGLKTPTINELRRNVQMIFLNVNSIWDFNRPVPPNIIYLGGLHQKEEKELPQDLKKFLDSSTNGVIYMSLGTNVLPSLLPPEKIKIFTRVFSTLPYDVLLKWDSDSLYEQPKNVKIFKWLPQSDLLRHPNIKVFITQGGLQSTDEAISAGVPLIGVPMLADQWYNTDQYVLHKIGIKLSIETLTENILINAIQTVIKDKSYRSNIIKLRNIIRDQPQSPLERAVWWTEYVLRHGDVQHLRASGFGLTAMEYYEVCLILLLLSTFTLIIFTCVYVIYVFIFKKGKTVNNKKNQ